MNNPSSSSCINCTCTSCQCSKSSNEPFNPNKTQIQVILKHEGIVPNDKVTLKEIARKLYLAFPLAIRCCPVYESHLALNLFQCASQALLLPKIRVALKDAGFDEKRVLLIEGSENRSPPKSTSSASAIKTTTLQLEGLTCSNCIHAVERILGHSVGVSSAEVSLDKAIVKHDNLIHLDRVIKRIEGSGFTVSVHREPEEVFVKSYMLEPT
jgi:copper chaperone CopZ